MEREIEELIKRGKSKSEGTGFGRELYSKMIKMLEETFIYGHYYKV